MIRAVVGTSPYGISVLPVGDGAFDVPKQIVRIKNNTTEK